MWKIVPILGKYFSPHEQKIYDKFLKEIVKGKMGMVRISKKNDTLKIEIRYGKFQHLAGLYEVEWVNPEKRESIIISELTSPFKEGRDYYRNPLARIPEKKAPGGI